MPKNKKILFIINGLGFGGAETQLIRLSNALADRNYLVSILTLSNDLPLLKQLDKRITHINIPLKKITLFYDLKKILTLVKQQQPNIIHAHLFQANIISRFIKFFNKKIRVINTTHGAYLLNTRNYNPYKIYKFTKKWVDLHTAVSQEVLELLIKNNSINTQKSTYIPNGLFVDKYFSANKNTEPFKWLSIGRLHPVKDYSNLIKTCILLKKENYSFKLDIAGDGDERENLEELIHNNNLEKEVKLLGIIEDIPNLLAKYNAFIISSYSEGLPMVLLEAMSSSLPIVSTNVGEIGNIIKLANGGIIVPPKNKEQLKIGMIKMMSFNTLELNELSNNNYKFVNEHYSMKKLVHIWIDIYFKS